MLSQWMTSYRQYEQFWRFRISLFQDARYRHEEFSRLYSDVISKKKDYILINKDKLRDPM